MYKYKIGAKVLPFSIIAANFALYIYIYQHSFTNI